MTGIIATIPKFQFNGADGLALSGGSLTTYLAGTTTLETTYQDQALTIANTNPIVLDSAGGCTIWLNDAKTYKFVLKNSVGVTQWTQDNINGATSLDQLSASSGAALVGYLPAGTGAVATTVQGKLRESVSIFDFMTLAQKSDVSSGAGSISISDAWQAAVNFCKASTCKTITMPFGAYLHTVPLDVTTSACNGISFVAQGGRKSGVTIKCSTDGWCVDLSGSAWTTWEGLYFIHGVSTPSKGAFLLGGTAANPECLYHNFDNCMVELYNASAPSSFGSIGFAVIGSEENTFHACNVFADTPYLFSTLYASISADYPSPYQTIQASHSCGVNTFSGENVAVTYDKKKSNISLYGANTINFGNMYFGNINITTPGTNQNCINVLGGSVDAVRGQFKVESKSTLLNFEIGELFDWKISVEFGAGTDPTYPVVNFPTPSTLAKNKVLGFECDVAYYSPADASFLYKKLISAPGVSNGSGNQAPVLSNIKFRVNQDSGFHGNPFFPTQFCGVGVNCVMEFPDCTYTLNKHKHVKQLTGQAYLGVGNGTGDVIGKVYLPVITAGYSARSLNVRISGLISSINESSGAQETLVTSCYFDTAKGAYSINDGVISVAANGASSDLILNTASIAMSNNAGLALFTGIVLDMTYNSGLRTIDLIAVPKGSGASLGGVLAFVNDVCMELTTSGRTQELIYLS